MIFSLKKYYKGFYLICRLQFLRNDSIFTLSFSWHDYVSFFLFLKYKKLFRKLFFITRQGKEGGKVEIELLTS